MTARVLFRLVAIDIVTTLEYRGAFILYMVSVVAGPVVSLLVWLAVSDQGVALPLDRAQLVTYYVLLGLVSMLTSSWLAESLGEMIRGGDLSAWLLRPTPYIIGQVSNNIAEKLVKACFLVPMLLVVAAIFHRDLQLPTAPAAWLLFLLCLPMAAAVTFLLDFSIGSLAFWIEDVNGLSRVRVLIASVLSGQVVPLALFPAWSTGLLQAQPFRYTLSFPLEVLLGRVSGGGLAFGLALQSGYVLLLCGVTRVVWRRGLRAYAATGA